VLLSIEADFQLCVRCEASERHDMLAFMREAGLRTHFQDQGLMRGRGLYIAVKA
jgi:hypothetical protein